MIVYIITFLHLSLFVLSKALHVLFVLSKAHYKGPSNLLKFFIAYSNFLPLGVRSIICWTFCKVITLINN